MLIVVFMVTTKKIFYKYIQKEMREEPKWYASKIKYKTRQKWRRWGEKGIRNPEKNSKMAPVNPSSSVITLHVSGLKSMSNKQRFVQWIKKRTPP